MRAIRSKPAAAAALGVGIGGMAIIAGAHFFQYVLLVAPCPLCLMQRKIWYAIIPIAFVVAILALTKAPHRLVLGGLIVLVLATLFSAGFGLYHSGVEWKWWTGPTDCTGPIASFGQAGGLIEQMQNTSIVRCDEASWRFLGLSLAGYNGLVSLALAAIAAWALAGEKRIRG